MIQRLLTFSALWLLCSCSTLPNPYQAGLSGGASGTGLAILKKSAESHGNRWDRFEKVEVSYSGTWAKMATRIQPVLTDSEFRKSSEESYFPRSGIVVQEHRGPGGSKSVRQTGDEVSISYNGTPSQDSEQRDASSLVVDAYTAFLFGPSWVLSEGQEFRLLASEEIEGEACDLVAATLRPGLGRAEEDQVIAWISRKSGWMRRLQFTLNGLESTKGADVDVVFSEMRKADDGSVWPTQFLERVQRPLAIKAHEWRMNRLILDGKKAF
ncbi:hypothetical protein [Haloferula sp.]|uniref:hypothetical protein n=1 Tax=Haloferula sp. TaxID=2497595 RepID=UPI0032A0B1BC